MFLEALPQVGSKESAFFILDLIQKNKVSDISAIQLLMRLPFHIRKPDVQLLASLQPFLALPSKISAEVQNTAILMYGTLIYKTCLVHCPYEMLDDYVRLYLDKFTGIKYTSFVSIYIIRIKLYRSDSYYRDHSVWAEDDLAGRFGEHTTGQSCRVLGAHSQRQQRRIATFSGACGLGFSSYSTAETRRCERSL